MCAVSMIYDAKVAEWQQRYWTQPAFYNNPYVLLPTAEEMREFRDLLQRAREYDKKHNQPDCELAEKRERLKKMADELGVEITFE